MGSSYIAKWTQSVTMQAHMQQQPIIQNPHTIKAIQ